MSGGEAFETMDRPRLLFISPVVPQPSGGGPAMRAWQFLLAFARHHRVTVVAGNPNFPAEVPTPPDFLASLVEDVVVLPWLARSDPSLALRYALRAVRPTPIFPNDWAVPTRAMRRRLDRIRGRRFCYVHVFRLGMLPVTLHLLDGDAGGISSLDLDDWESKTRKEIASLLTLREPRAARCWMSDASAYARLEASWLPRIRRVVVCSEEDRDVLAQRHQHRGVVVVANGVRVPVARPASRSSADPTFLFVGSLGYPPNEDAVRFFLREVLPWLRRDEPRVRFCIAGGGAPRSLRRMMAGEPRTDWLGRVDSIEQCYAEALAAVVPVRAGGGTRIKVLEAFAQGRPVVSTSIGTAGIDIVPGRHYLHAETPEAWQRCCAALLSDPSLGTRLAAEAFDRVRRYDLSSVAVSIERLVEDGA